MSYVNNKANDARSDESGRVADAVKPTVAQRHRAANPAREGLNTLSDMPAQVADSTRKALQSGAEAAPRQTREASDRLTRTLGFSGEDSWRLARQSKQNMDVVTRFGTVLAQAVQDTSRGWLELGQRQFQRNVEGVDRLMRAKSVQEFTTTQSDLVREGIQHMVQDGRAIAERSLRAIDEAGQTFSAVPGQSSSQAR